MIKLSAPAKINLSLDITGVRQDGYHLLDMICLPVGICDVVYLKKAKEGIKLDCGPNLPSDQRNIAWRAARMMLDEFSIGSGVRITIEKHIPMEAGLGGGSADAAAVMRAMAKLFEIEAGEERLIRLGARLGADVPILLAGRPVRARGIGEEITPLECRASFRVVVVKPAQGLSTPVVYRLYDSMPDVFRRPDNDALGEALKAGDALGIAKHMANVLEPGAVKLCPQIEEIKRELTLSGAFAAMMTGSGSAVFGLYHEGDKARRAAKELAERWGWGEVTEVNNAH